MRPLRNRERRLGAATGAIIVAAGFVWLVVDPQLRRQRTLVDEVERRATVLAGMQRNMLLKDRIERRYDQLQSLIRRSRGEDKELAAFTRSLSSLHAGTNLQVGSLRVLPSIDEGDYVRLVARLELRGHVQHVMVLLDSLARMPEPMRADRIEISCRQQADVVDACLEISHVVAPTSAEMSTATAHSNGATRRRSR